MVAAAFSLFTFSLFAELPDSFVEYVESTDAGTYLDSGIAGNPRYTRVMLKLAPTVVDNTTRGVFGSRASTGDAGSDACYFYQTGMKFRMDWIQAASASSTLTAGTIYTLQAIDYRAYVDDRQFRRADYNDGSKSATDGKNLYFFNMNNNGLPYTYGLPQKLYYARVYKSETLQGSFIPCVKNGVAGLYNATAGEILYPASDTTALTASTKASGDFRINGGVIEARLTVAAGEGGTLDRSGDDWIAVGATVTITATPESGKQPYWTSDHEGALQSRNYAGATITFTMPAWPVEVSAAFVSDETVPFVSDLNTYITAASEGDVITLGEGTYRLTSALAVNKKVTIRGQGRGKTVLSPDPKAEIRGIYMTEDATIRDLSVVGFTNKVNGSGVYMTKGTLDNVRVADGRDDRYNLYSGCGIWMSGGTVTNCVVENNSVYSTYGGSQGIGIYASGGTIVDSEILNNWRERTEFSGGGIRVAGASVTVRRCLIKGNGSKGKGHGAANTRGMGVYMDANGLVEDCRIVSNDIHAVWMSNGTLRNCLIYGHKTTSTGYTAGIEQSGGYVYNCTVAGNEAPNAFAGLKMSSGTSVNNIFYGNTGTANATVSSGTFHTNVVDSASSVTTSKAVGTIMSDPGLLGAANGEFTIDYTSVAYDAGATLAGVAHDLLGLARPQGSAYDIGCYEYVYSGSELEVVILSSVEALPEGGTPSVSARVLGAEGEVTYQWYVNDVLSDQTSATPVFSDLPAGAYTIKLTVTCGGKSKSATKENAFTVMPTEVWVDETDGDDTANYPFNASGKPAKTVNAAFDALWRDADNTVTIHIGEGTYYLTGELALTTKCNLYGAGREKTILNGAGLSSAYRGISLTKAGSVLKDFTVTGCTNNIAGGGVYMTADCTLDNIAIVKNTHNAGSSSLAGGCGLWMKSGLLTNCVISANAAVSTYGGCTGIGVYIEGGTLVDCEICDNWRDRNEFSGAGVYVNGSSVVVRRCLIKGNSSKTKGNNTSNTRGMGVYMTQNALVEDCQIVSNDHHAVWMSTGTLKNCLVFGHKTTSASYTAGIEASGSAKIYNCTVSDNTAPNTFAGMKMTGGTAVNNIIYGNTTEDVNVTGGTFNTNVVGSVANVTTATADGNITVDPWGAEKPADYTITHKSSAYNAGAELAAVTHDLLGTARPMQERYDIGCYEIIHEVTELECTISISQTYWPKGSVPTASVTAEGGTGVYTYRWYVDGQLTEESEATATFENMASGSHTVKVVVSDGEDEVQDEIENAITVRPVVVYVDVNGSNEAPYETALTAATNVNDALDALWFASDSTGTVYIAAGEYFLSSQLNLSSPCRMIGAGRDVTVLNGAKLASAYRAVDISAEGSLLKSLTVTGCTNALGGAAIKMSKGTVEDVRSTRNAASASSTAGIGISISGGTVVNSIFDFNRAEDNSSGIGVYISGGTISDCVIRDNFRRADGSVNSGCRVFGVGMRISGSTAKAVRCRVENNHNCGCKTSDTSYPVYGGVYADGGATIEDCAIVSNAWCGVYANNVKLRNTLVTGHVHPWNNYPGGVRFASGEMVNCTVAGNDSPTAAMGDIYMSGGKAYNNVGLAVHVADGVSSNNVFSADAGLVNPSRGNCRLRKSSPAVDAADTQYWTWSDPAAASDVVGNRRLVGGKLDCGCYEHRQAGIAIFLR